MHEMLVNQRIKKKRNHQKSVRWRKKLDVIREAPVGLVGCWTPRKPTRYHGKVRRGKVPQGASSSPCSIKETGLIRDVIAIQVLSVT